MLKFSIGSATSFPFRNSFIQALCGRLGHTNTSTTLNIYSHALEEFDRKASDVLSDTLMKKHSVKILVPKQSLETAKAAHFRTAFIFL